MHKEDQIHHKKSALPLLALGALGVVYGDIATSPLYAINEIFFGHGGLPPVRDNIYSAISLVIWVITIAITVKYLIFVLRADNEGEGGVYALYGILNKFKRTGKRYLLTLLLLAAGMLFGDGIITPSISVLSAVEGLNIATPVFAPYIVPLTVTILIALFFIQRFGTSSVGRVFGPIILIWLISIATLGAHEIFKNPEILVSLNPIYALKLLIDLSLSKLFLLLGAVMLVITGGEALYADMSHFGKAPIRLGWFSAVFPCLILNYLGQGAYLLSGQPIKNGNIFFSMVPTLAMFPIVILACCATVIASQALISGAFSLTSQAVALGLFPRVKYYHTHREHIGQIYIPFVNWTLCIGCLLLVLTFRSSSALASAYGLAVSGDMVTTSISMLAISQLVWKWSRTKALIVFGFFACIDSLFLTANSLKFFEGGFIPFSLGVGLFCVMKTWGWGRKVTYKMYSNQPTRSISELVLLKENQLQTVDRTIILMCPSALNEESDNIPLLAQHYIDRYDVLPKHLILLDVYQRRVPYIHRDRCIVRKFQDDPEKGSVSSVTVNFGFMEEPDVESILDDLRNHQQLNLSQDHSKWYIHVAKEKLVEGQGLSFFSRIRLKFFLFMRANSLPSYYYFGLGQSSKLSVEVFPIRIEAAANDV